jgi:hypothetical protein
MFGSGIRDKVSRIRFAQQPANECGSGSGTETLNRLRLSKLSVLVDSIKLGTGNVPVPVHFPSVHLEEQLPCLLANCNYRYRRRTTTQNSASPPVVFFVPVLTCCNCVQVQLQGGACAAGRPQRSPARL